MLAFFLGQILVMQPENRPQFDELSFSGRRERRTQSTTILEDIQAPPAISLSQNTMPQKFLPWNSLGRQQDKQGLLSMYILCDSRSVANWARISSPFMCTEKTSGLMKTCASVWSPPVGFSFLYVILPFCLSHLIISWDVFKNFWFTCNFIIISWKIKGFMWYEFTFPPSSYCT